MNRRDGYDSSNKNIEGKILHVYVIPTYSLKLIYAFTA